MKTVDIQDSLLSRNGYCLPPSLGRAEEHFISAKLQAPGDAPRNFRFVLEASSYFTVLRICKSVMRTIFTFAQSLK